MRVRSEFMPFGLARDRSNNLNNSREIDSQSRTSVHFNEPRRVLLRTALLDEDFLGNLREFSKFGIFMNQDGVSRDCGCADPAIGNR